MSYGNPYQPSNYVPAEKPVKGTLKLQLGEMFQFPFSNPNWVTNTVMCSLCLVAAHVIPVVPQLVLQGYQWELLEALHLRRTKTYADFDFNRIMPYLTRGVWPFLVTLVATFVVMLVVFPVMAIFFGIFVAVMNSLGNNGGDLVALLLFVGIFLLSLFMGVVINVVMLPLMLRAALCQDFGMSFNVAWLRSFIGLMWKELILGVLVLMAASMGMFFVGLLLFCVGVWPAMVLVVLMHTHFLWQLYEIFLDRGGEPVPLKQQAAY